MRRGCSTICLGFAKPQIRQFCINVASDEKWDSSLKTNFRWKSRLLSRTQSAKIQRSWVFCACLNTTMSFLECSIPKIGVKFVFACHRIDVSLDQFFYIQTHKRFLSSQHVRRRWHANTRTLDLFYFCKFIFICRKNYIKQSNRVIKISIERIKSNSFNIIIVIITT